MCWGELLKTNCRTLQTAPLLPFILQESLRVGIAVATPGNSCWVSHLRAGFVPLEREGAEGDLPVQKELIWPCCAGSLGGHSWCPPAPWMVPAGGGTTAVGSCSSVCPLYRATVGFVQPGSTTSSFHTCLGQVSCRGGERTGNGVHCCTSHAYPTALLHHCSSEGLVPSPISRSSRCSLETVR